MVGGCNLLLGVLDYWAGWLRGFSGPSLQE